MPDDVSPHHPANAPPADAGDCSTTPPVPTPDRTVVTGQDQSPTVFPVVPPSAVIVPGFEVVREISRGGMGVVYEARQLGLNRVVALKMVLGEGRADAHVVRRFLVEAAAVAAVVHDHVVQVHQCGEYLGRPFMALEYCPGGTLAEYLRGVRLTPRAAAELVAKVAGGVAAAHAAGIVHRDIKPGNVLFDAHGEPKVADFGLAKLTAGADRTQGGGVMGTPAYMAPEQASGDADRVGYASDVWALGVILYEALTNTRPFDGGSTNEILAAVQHRDPGSPRGAVAGIPRDLEFILLKCLRKDPRDRYPTAAELAAELGQFLDGESLGGRRREWGYRARQAVAKGGRSAVLVGAVLLAAAGVWRATRPAPAPPAPEDPSVALRREEVLQRILALDQTTPVPDKVSPHPTTRVAKLTPTDWSKFRVLYDDRVIDLRACRADATNDPASEYHVLFHTRKVMTKIEPVALFRGSVRTTGRDVVSRVITPNPDRAEVFAGDDLLPVGGQHMKVRQMVYDVSTIPVGTEFTTQGTDTFWNPPLRAAEDRWFGTIGSDGTLKVSMLMVFPPDRPFKDYTLRVAPESKAPPVPYTGPMITFKADDNRWIYWEVVSPKTGHVYRIDWNW